MSIEKMLEEYKTVVELQAFAEAQFKTIQELNKKARRLEEENTKLLIAVDSVKSVGKTEDFDYSKFLESSDQETIAKIQLKKLKEISFNGELTLEETKRVEIFTKILVLMNEKNKVVKSEGKRLDDGELLKLLENPDVNQA